MPATTAATTNTVVTWMRARAHAHRSRHPFKMLARRVAAIVFTLATIGALGPLYGLGAPVEVTYGDVPGRHLPAAKSSPAALMEKHDCWNGSRPAGKTTTDAIVALPGRVVPVLTADLRPQRRAEVFDQALTEALTDEDTPVERVYAFCEIGNGA